jgi:adenosylmethionine-8-amino-7-oxononanoate aminotransferase
MNKLLRTFPLEPLPPTVVRGEGVYLFMKNGDRYLDTTGGGTGHITVGWSHPKVISDMMVQLKKITHIDYKFFGDENRETLADLMLSKGKHGLDRFYFAGSSGGEACEGAMKLCYQYFYDQGKPQKNWFISRLQSYHGSSTDALAVGDRPNLNFYAPLFPINRAKVSDHNPVLHRKPRETEDEYARRSARELEDKIIEIGPDKVCAFIGETIMGGLVGDVPPAPNYWKYIREVCSKYDVFLILDEVWCGTGTSGKTFCCDWDNVRPDLIFFGKTFASGYGAVSAIVLDSKIEKVIAAGQGRVQHSTTHQGHSLSVAAALSVQSIIHESGFLEDVNKKGEFLRAALIRELGSHPFFFNVRGRGLRNSFEYRCPRQHEFSLALTQRMYDDHQIMISGKWHRVCFSPAITITTKELEFVLDRFVSTFKSLASSWSDNEFGCRAPLFPVGTSERPYS